MKPSPIQGGVRIDEDEFEKQKYEYQSTPILTQALMPTVKEAISKKISTICSSEVACLPVDEDNHRHLLLPHPHQPHLLSINQMRPSPLLLNLHHRLEPNLKMSNLHHLLEDPLTITLQVSLMSTKALNLVEEEQLTLTLMPIDQAKAEVNQTSPALQDQEANLLQTYPSTVISNLPTPKSLLTTIMLILNPKSLQCHLNPVHLKKSISKIHSNPSVSETASIDLDSSERVKKLHKILTLLLKM